MTTLTARLQLGEPVEHRGIVLAPLFPRSQPRAAYVTLDEALPLGFRVTEVSVAGSVPELLVRNPLDAAVLLYDGEELVGAKQNRILNLSVLVPAWSETVIAVSCVEQGRWSARSVAFSAARHAAHPELRRVKAEVLLARDNAQHEVWNAVSAKAMRLGAFSPTGAQADVFASRERDLAALRGAFPLEPGQAGAVLALGPELLCLDYVSRPEAFEHLYRKLLDGYLLDAIEHLDVAPAEAGRLEGFVGAVTAAPRRRQPSAGLGEDVRVAADGVVGSGLELDGELVQVSAFTSEKTARASRLARPSRRRA
ncbi:MAG: ARPP-1 family domain-containing protein [Gaiellaceae bacterium]